MPNESANLRPPEAAAHLSVSISYLAKMRLTGQGPRYSKLSPKLVLYSRADLDAWVASRVRASTTDRGAAQ